MTSPSSTAPAPEVASAAGEAEVRDRLIIRFAGDSGDGMQLTGSRFTETAAMAGHDVATLPDFPAEIRAPAGSLAGVSGFQLHFAGTDIHTPGDAPDVLVAMNPAALLRNLPDLQRGCALIVDDSTFSAKNLKRAGFASNPLEDDSLESFRVFVVPLAKLAVDATEEVEELSARERERTKNFFALGLCFWMFGHDLEATLRWIDRKFGAGTPTSRANHLALRKGWDYGVTTEAFAHRIEVRRATLPKGTWRNITGNQATAFGFLTAAQQVGRDLVLGTYPITPASDILHELARHKGFGVRTIQAEDEIAAICMAIGASYGGAIGLTSSSGPGISLKGEAMGLALMVELPLVVINVQRGGPSTGLPTKTEQSDLLQAFYGRHGEAPLAILAPSTPSDCFAMAIEAVRIATRFMTPVLFLSDGYIANSSEPWRVPDLSALPDLRVEAPRSPEAGETFLPFARDPETLARPWAVPGQPGLEHRIGGLEKAADTGHISYDPNNHEVMVRLRAEKIAGIADHVPPQEVMGDEDADVLVCGWGGTAGSIRTAVELLRREGIGLAFTHFRYLNPFPRNTEALLRRYRRVIVPELNAGQLVRILRSEFLIDARPISKIQGRPFTAVELADALRAHLEDA